MQQIVYTKAHLAKVHTVCYIQCACAKLVSLKRVCKYGVLGIQNFRCELDWFSHACSNYGSESSIKVLATRQKAAFDKMSFLSALLPKIVYVYIIPCNPVLTFVRSKLQS